jgi:hypothetical protein
MLCKVGKILLRLIACFYSGQNMDESLATNNIFDLLLRQLLTSTAASLV